jgi:phenol 2-monooxygenase
MQDTFNLGWKLAAVLLGRCSPKILHTYSAERQAIAKELIDFDREWAKMLSAPLKSSTDGEGVDPADVQKYFVKHAHYTAGTATKYKPSLITAKPRYQHLAKGLVIGMRFHSAPVIRVPDAKPIRLGDAAKADGRWRIFAFADRQAPSAGSSRMRALCDFLVDSPQSPVRRYTPAEGDIDSLIDVRAVVQQGHRELDLSAMPQFLLPAKGRYGLRDYEKLYCPDLKGNSDIFDMRGIDRDRGCVVVVRPDQYVADVMPLDAHADLSAFFDGFMLPAT